MSYITVADITDKIVDGIEISEYIAETDQEIKDLAEKVGVRDSADIEDDPLHYKIKRYGICYTIMRVCQDLIGSNNVDVPEMEKYFIKYNMYQRELQKLSSEITFEMVTGDVDEIRDRAVVTGTLFRG